MWERGEAIKLPRSPPLPDQTRDPGIKPATWAWGLTENQTSNLSVTGRSSSQPSDTSQGSILHYFKVSFIHQNVLKLSRKASRALTLNPFWHDRRFLPILKSHVKVDFLNTIWTNNWVRFHHSVGLFLEQMPRRSQQRGYTYFMWKCGGFVAQTSFHSND